MRLAPFLSYGVLFWVAAIVAAPLLVRSGSSAPVMAGVVVYRAASVVCHQIPERSFQLSALPLAVCARCFGLYVGAAVASIALMLFGSRVLSPGSTVPHLPSPGSGGRILLAVAALPTAITWLLERGGVWAGTNGIRFAAALPLGLAAATLVLDALRGETANKVD